MRTAALRPGFLVGQGLRAARARGLELLDPSSPPTARPRGDRAIEEAAWQTLDDYPPISIAQIAETRVGDQRLIVHRLRTLDAQGELLPSWE